MVQGAGPNGWLQKGMVVVDESGLERLKTVAREVIESDDQRGTAL